MASTTDGWTARINDGYLSFTINYVTADFMSKVFQLDLTHYTKSHSAQNIHDFLKDCFKNWGV